MNNNKTKFSSVSSDLEDTEELWKYFSCFFPPILIKRQNIPKLKYICALKESRECKRGVCLFLSRESEIYSMHLLNEILKILLKLCERTLSTISFRSFSMNTDWREEQSFFSQIVYTEEEFVCKIQSQRPSPDASLEKLCLCIVFFIIFSPD